MNLKTGFNQFRLYVILAAVREMTAE